jgi:hypothetical protein
MKANDKNRSLQHVALWTCVTKAPKSPATKTPYANVVGDSAHLRSQTENYAETATTRQAPAALSSAVMICRNQRTTSDRFCELLRRVMLEAVLTYGSIFAR